MHKIVNRTNSPFDLQAVGGKVVLPAHGDVTAEFDAGYLDLLRSARTVDVKEVKTGTDKPQLDHDKNEKAGGSVPAADRGLDDLRAQYEELFGKAPDMRWGEKRLTKDINAKLAE